MTMDEVNRLPSNRQIIPLTSGRSGIGSMTSGSITVEVCAAVSVVSVVQGGAKKTGPAYLIANILKTP